MARNPLIGTKIKSLRGDIDYWRTVKQKLSNDLYDAILMRNFFNTWKDSTYTSAVEGLPDDNPDTSIYEGVSEEEFKDMAEGFFGNSWGNITDPNHDGLVSQAELQSNVSAVFASVREIIVKQSSVSSTIDDIKSEIQDLILLEQNER